MTSISTLHTYMITYSNDNTDEISLICSVSWFSNNMTSVAPLLRLSFSLSQVDKDATRDCKPRGVHDPTSNAAQEPPFGLLQCFQLVYRKGPFLEIRPDWLFSCRMHEIMKRPIKRVSLTISSNNAFVPFPQNKAFKSIET